MVHLKKSLQREIFIRVLLEESEILELLVGEGVAVIACARKGLQLSDRQSAILVQIKTIENVLECGDRGVREVARIVEQGRALLLCWFGAFWHWWRCDARRTDCFAWSTWPR